MKRKNLLRDSFSISILLLLLSIPIMAQDKPNILVIWGDDIGWSNISKYNHGMMGYETPNIDRIGDEGAMFRGNQGQRVIGARSEISLFRSFNLRKMNGVRNWI
jgi:hypothetical protein